MNLAVKISDLSFAWNPGGKNLLEIDLLEIKSGERVFFQGPSGSGKTSFLSLLGGVLAPNRGQINILGTAIERLSGPQRDSFRADHIGFIFQMFNLLPYLSIQENVELAVRFSKRKLKRALEVAPGQNIGSEVERILEALGLGEGFADRKISHLSVGQQQRVAVARALIGSPEIIIADEPTSSLDSQSRTAFLDLLLEECEKAGSTIIYVSHDQDVGKYFDRTIDISEFKPKS